VDGVKIYREPSFVIHRNARRKFFCRDQEGKLVAEFVGMSNLTDYVCKKTGKSATYVKQRVYKRLNKKIEFLGYYWTDK
jgi:hypothetical protein